MFSDKPKPLNIDYFKTLWSRFKRKSNTLEHGQALYSFRHSGAIEVFKRTDSLTKLQKAMGQSSLNVSLTYLRKLEVAGLKEKTQKISIVIINFCQENLKFDILTNKNLLLK